MFVKGSRYRNLSESSPIDANGERLKGKDLRLIDPPEAWPFRHAVRDGDRLDLLSFKYYGDATKWWQIADANPQEPFPLDLLDRDPVVKERFVLRSPNFETRFRNAVLALSAFGPVRTPEITSFDDSQPAEPNFLETTLVVTYPQATETHQLIVDELEAPAVGFHFLRSFAWRQPPNTVEAFTFEDPTTRNRWRNIVTTLRSIGVLELQSLVGEATLDLVYNSMLTPRESVLKVFSSNAFVLQPETTAFPTVGSKIVIPPNRIV
jgi:hypothetical protein